MRLPLSSRGIGNPAGLKPRSKLMTNEHDRPKIVVLGLDRRVSRTPRGLHQKTKFSPNGPPR